MKSLTLAILCILGVSFFLTSCTDDDEPCTEQTWHQDGDGLGNPDVSLSSCDQPTDYVSDNSDTDDSGNNTGLHAAFAEFDADNFSIYLDGDDVVIESNGLPNHTSPYWSNTTERSAVDPMGNTLTTEAAAQNHTLFSEPTTTSYAHWTIPMHILDHRVTIII